jgi:hypothetical protein
MYRETAAMHAPIDSASKNSSYFSPVNAMEEESWREETCENALEFQLIESVRETTAAVSSIACATKTVEFKTRRV